MTDQQDPAVDMSPQAAFGRNLRTIREARGLSQADCVELLATFGIRMHRQTLHKIETNARPLKLDEAMQIADALGADLDFMTRGEDEFRLYELSGEIEKAYFAAFQHVMRMYELQIQLARALDEAKTEHPIGVDELSLTASDLDATFVTRMLRWKERRDQPGTSPFLDALDLEGSPNFYRFTIPDYPEQGEYTQRFLDAHPELKREAHGGSAS